MRYVTKAFLFAAALLLGLEGLARLAFEDTFVGRFDYGYHPTAGFVEKADHVELRSAGGRRFWPQSFARPKPKGRYRIFTVGDSVARGRSLEQAYPYLLGEMLKAKGYDVESLNLSVPGYGVRRRQVVLDQVLKYEPDLIILHLNHTNEYEDERDWRRAQEAKSWYPDQWLRKSYIIARLDEAKTERLFWKLPADIRATREVRDHDAELAAAEHGEQGKVWEQFFRTQTLKTLELLRAHQIPVVLLTKGWIEEGKQEISDGGYDLYFKQHQEGGVCTASTREIFELESNIPQLFNKDRVHIKPSGHVILAKGLLPKVERCLFAGKAK